MPEALNSTIDLNNWFDCGLTKKF